MQEKRTIKSACYLMARFAKSLVYLGSFTAFGYVLMKLTEPTPEKLKEIHGTKYKDPETRRRQELLLQKLKEAAEKKDPVYVQKKSPDESEKPPSKREII